MLQNLGSIKSYHWDFKLPGETPVDLGGFLVTSSPGIGAPEIYEFLTPTKTRKIPHRKI